MLGQTGSIEAVWQYICGSYCKNRFKASYYIDGYRLDEIQDVNKALMSDAKSIEGGQSHVNHLKLLIETAIHMHI